MLDGDPVGVTEWNIREFRTGAAPTYGVGLTRLLTLPDGRAIRGKSGARSGYNAVIAATAGARSRLVCSVNSTDAKAVARAPVLERIVTTAVSLLWSLLKVAIVGFQSRSQWPRPGQISRRRVSDRSDVVRGGCKRRTAGPSVESP